MTAMTPAEVKQKIFADVGLGVPEEFVATRGVKGVITGALNKALGEDIHRRMVLAWLFDAPHKEISSKELDDEKWWALYQWVGFYQDENLQWQRRPEFKLEAMLVFTEAVRELSEHNIMNDSNSMLEQAVAFMGGVATNASDSTDYEYSGEVQAPPQYTEKTRRRIIRFLDGADDII